LSGQFDWLVTVDPHLHRRRSLAEIYTIPAEVVHAAPLLAQWIRGHVTNPLVVGPDAESEQWARTVAEAVPCPHIVLEKTRLGDRDVVVSAIPKMESWADRTPVLVDDIISSARTMIETVRQWTGAGLPHPVCLAVHGVFAPQAYEALKEAGAARIVTTNSIPHASNDIDISQVLIEPVRRLLARAKDSRSARTVSVEK
jgi:ribose-phosphate pyrophosphokinase